MKAPTKPKARPARTRIAARVDALARVMVEHGLTRVAVGDLVVERPPQGLFAPRELPAPGGSKGDGEREMSAIEKMRNSPEYKAYARGAPLNVE